MTDIVTRLRAHFSSDSYAATMDTAANEIERLRQFMDWRRIDDAPTDEWVLLADSGGYVNQAIFGEDEENPRWRLASGDYLHPNFKPMGWMPMPINDWHGAQDDRH